MRMTILVVMCMAAAGCADPGRDLGGRDAGLERGVDGSVDGGHDGSGATRIEKRFTGVAVVKALACGTGWVVLQEKPKAQYVVTVPEREAVVLDGRLEFVRSLPAVDGFSLVDVAAHASGDVSGLYVRFDFADPRPLRMQLSRWVSDGSRVDVEISPEAPVDPPFIATFDRGRVVVAGESVYVAIRWPGNAVYAYRVDFFGQELHQAWATRVEPEADLGVLGIIGGGYDNLRQGENAFFVYLDVDETGNAYLAVPSTSLVLPAHDMAFGERLSDGADPVNADYGVAILTKLDSNGARVYARLLGTAGRSKSLLGVRAGAGVVSLTGREKTGSSPESWDAWLLAAGVEAGTVLFERVIDVQQGDAFWDATPVPGGWTVAVGTTGYTQNPSGVSVSDAREALAVILDAQGQVTRRLELPRGVEARGDEAVFVRLGDTGRLVVAGMLDGPGTHAEVRSNGFVEVMKVDALLGP